MSLEIYLDMDGVCVDFMGAAIRANGLDAEDTLKKWKTEHPGSLFPEPLIGKGPFEFFTHDNIAIAEFWSELVPYDWYNDLYAGLSELGHVMFLTAPTGAPGCAAGKHQWLIDRFGPDYSDFIFTRHKHRLAHDKAVLVDDMLFNIEAFEKRGGKGALFPQIWNEGHHIDDPLAHVLGTVREFID